MNGFVSLVTDIWVGLGLIPFFYLLFFAINIFVVGVSILVPAATYLSFKPKTLIAKIVFIFYLVWFGLFFIGGWVQISSALYDWLIVDTVELFENGYRKNKLGD